VAVWVAHILNTGYDRGTEQRVWWWMAPVLVFWRKVHAGQVASDTSHGNIAAPPWSTKVEIECIILDVCAPRIALCVALAIKPLLFSSQVHSRFRGYLRIDGLRQPLRLKASRPRTRLSYSRSRTGDGFGD
jgi:hypothetical protein